MDWLNWLYGECALVNALLDGIGARKLVALVVKLSGVEPALIPTARALARSVIASCA